MRLLLTLLLLTCLSANAQPLWRNFFTTNQNPRVTVVAGSNATVQASTVGFDQRIFTVNAVPGAGTGQTNNTIVIAGTNGVVVVTNSSGGITTYTVHNTNIAGISQTNWPLSSITNANYLTNWALIPTNFVPSESSHATNADFVLTATLTNKMYASNVVSGGQVPIGVLSPTAGANGWFLIQSNGVSEWSLNGASLTNVPFTFWTNYTSNPNDSTNLNGLAYGSGMYGMTSFWSYATAPGVGPIGIFYNGIDTNTVISTNGGSFSGRILDISASASAPISNQLVTASWVRNLFNTGAAYYNSTNIQTGATNADMANQYVYSYQSTIPLSSVRTYTATDFLTNNGYVGAVVTTNTFSSLAGTIVVNAYLAYTAGGGASSVPIKPEIYISSDRTNWYNEVSASSQNISSGTTNLYQWLIDFPSTAATNAAGFYVQRRFKVVGTPGGSGTKTLYVFVGTNAVSGTADAAHLTMQSPTATAGNAYLANNQAFTGSNYFAGGIGGSVFYNVRSVFDGDSLTWLGWPNRWLTNYPVFGKGLITNYAISGSWSERCVTGVLARLTGWAKTKASDELYYSLYIGNNDLDWGTNATTLASNIQYCVTVATNLGYRPILWTIQNRGAAYTHETERSAFNNWLRSNYLAFNAVLFEPDIIFPQTPNTNWYYDGEHFTTNAMIELCRRLDEAVRTQTGGTRKVEDVSGNTVITGSYPQYNAINIFTTATLPTPPAGYFPTVYCTDVLTSRGSGDFVSWDGSNWRTREYVVATTTIPTFILNGWSACLNAQTPRSSIYFTKEPSTVFYGYTHTFTAYGAGYVGPNTDGTSGVEVGIGTGTGASGGVAATGILSKMTEGEYYGMFCCARTSGANATDSYWASFGSGSGTATNYPTSGAFFLYDPSNTNSHGFTGTATNDWIAVTCQGGGANYTYTDTGLAAAASGYDRLGIILTTTNCVFYTNGVAAATHTSNIPTADQYMDSERIVRVHGSTQKYMFFTAPSVHIRQTANRTF